MSAKMKKTLAAASALLFSQTISAANASADAVCFVLGEYDGRIALLEEGSAEPLAIYETPIESLYPTDAELLRSGIRIENPAELTRLIEDLEIE